LLGCSVNLLISIICSFFELFEKQRIRGVIEFLLVTKKLEKYMVDSSVKSGTKRLSLRFKINEQPVKYKTAYEDGEAFLLNISTGGCAVRKARVAVEVGENILFSFDVNNLDEPLELKAVCTRLEDDGFAVRFLGVESQEETRIVKIFAELARS